MSLTTFDRARPFQRLRGLSGADTGLAGAGAGPASAGVGSADDQAPASMRFMETGLALVAITVALLLNLGR